MAKFKEYFTYDCISFSFLILIYSTLSAVKFFSQPDASTVYGLFAMTSGAVILMSFTDDFCKTNMLKRILVDIIDIFISVFILGFAFDMFDFSLKNIVLVIIIVIAIYFGVFGIAIIKSQADASCINHKIQQMKGLKGKEGKTHE